MGVATGVGIGLSAAIADLVSKEKDLVHIKRFIASSMLLSLLSILAFFYVAIFHAGMIENVAGLNKLSPDSLITSEFRKYWKVILWTFPMQIFFALTIQYLTILEKQKAGINIVLMLLVLNVVLDYLFTRVMPWGVEGLAYSTMCVFSFGVLVSLIPLRNEVYFKLPYPSISDKAFLAAFGKISLTTFLVFLTIVIFSISGIILNRLALGLSTAALVCYAVFRQIMEVVILVTRGFSGGFIIYFGNALRDKLNKEYFPIYWAATAWIAIVNLTGIFFMLFFPDTLIGFFENIEAELYAEIKNLFKVGAVILFIFILPRMAQIGFISLDKAVFLVLFSVVFVVVQLLIAFQWIDQYGVFSLVYAELLACFSCMLIFCPLFYYFLMNTKAKSQTQS